jgi:four helix bundle protein
MIKSYRDLEVWQQSMDLVVECYQITKQFPKNELYGLSSQLQRAAVSVPSNIAEGRQRQHKKEFIQHLAISVWFACRTRNTASNSRAIKLYRWKQT